MSFPVDLAKYLPSASKALLARTGLDQGDSYLRAVVQGSSPVLPRYRTALARAMSGGAPVTIAAVGDSLDMGAGAGSGGTTNCNGAKLWSWPSQLASLFTSAGVAATAVSSWGNNLAPGGIAGAVAYDPNLSFGTPADWSATIHILGGGAFSNSTTTTAMSFTPPAATDKIDVYYARNGGLGQFTVKDAAATLGTPDSNGAAGLIKVSFTRTLSTNAINIARNGTGGAIFIAGIDTWNSATAKAKIFGMGAYGTSTTDWVVTGVPYAPLDALDAVNPDLIFLGLGTNDKTLNIAAATFKANLQSIITRRRAVGAEVILVRPHPNSDTTNDALLPGYQAALYDLARSNGLLLLDMRQRYVSFAARNALGDYFDGVHQTRQGYGDHANARWSLIRPQ